MIADTIFLILKSGDIDVKGTRDLAKEIYSSFTRFGTRSFLMLNRVSGFCSPNPSLVPSKLRTNKLEWASSEEIAIEETGVQSFFSIPCYYDTQFASREYLTTLGRREHPFSAQITKIASLLQ